jgi:hypothetical protein
MAVVQLNDGRLTGSVDVTFSYDAHVIELIKSTVLSTRRTYNPNSKVWTVQDVTVTDLIAALKHSGHVVDDRRTVSGTDSKTTANDNSWADLLFQALDDPDRAEAAYRALIRVVHPDSGGTTALAQQLNAARQRARFAGRRSA